MKSLNQNFADVKDLKRSAPATLAVFHFPSGDVHVSDHGFTAGEGGPVFLGAVTEWGGIASPSRGLFSIGLPETTVELANTGDPPFSGYLEGCTPEDVYVDLYQWFKGLDYADKEPIGRFVISSPISYSEGSVRVTLVSAFVKRNRVVGRKIGRDEYPQTDPDAVGTVENIIYGATKNVACRPIVSGAATTLATDISDTQTAGIELSMAPDETAFPQSGTLQIGGERVSYTGVSGKSLAGVARGANGTQPTAHKKGAAVFEVRSDFKYLVAGHPVKSIGDVYVGGVRVLSGVAKDIDDSGKATIVFSDRFILEKAVSLSANEPGHAHGGASKDQQGTGGSHYPSGTSYWTGQDSAMHDGDTSTNKLVGQSSSWAAGSYARVTFPTWSGGTVRNVRVCLTYALYNRVSGSCSFGLGSDSFTLSDASYPITVKFSVGASYKSELRVTPSCPGSMTVEVYEMWQEVESDTTTAGSGVSIVGNSTADVVIGGRVTCDVEGWQDDTAGTHTGSPNALIENPADVIRHFMVFYMGLPEDEVDSSFVATRAGLSQAITGGYRFAGVISRPVDAFDLLEDWAAQSRTRLSHDGWMAGLRLIANPPHTVDKVLSRTLIRKGGLRVSRTGREEVINRLDIHYLKDLSKDGDMAVNYMGIAGSSQSYPADGDPASVLLYGIRSSRRPFLFGFVADAGMASDLRDFYITRFKDSRRRAFMSLFLNSFELEEGDVVEMDFPSPTIGLDGAKFYVECVRHLPGSASRGRPDEIFIQAREV